MSSRDAGITHSDDEDYNGLAVFSKVVAANLAISAQQQQQAPEGHAQGKPVVDNNHLDAVEKRENLRHLTLARPKGPVRRAPTSRQQSVRVRDSADDIETTSTVQLSTHTQGWITCDNCHHLSTRFAGAKLWCFECTPIT